MRILYFSVHQILEFDEIRLLHSLGCFVFPLGIYFGGVPSQPFRPAIDFKPPFEDYMGHFAADGGRFGSLAEIVVPRAFVERFDAVIVMHEFDFLEKFWDELSVVPVIWRSIGVGTELFESRVRSLRDRGCRVVRYCPTEQLASGYAGGDAVIRFGKPDSDFVPWLDAERQILTFSHQFRQRFPVEQSFYVEATRGLPTMLGGGGNDDLPGSIGVVDFARQSELLSKSAAYFYAGGTFIPYTLNFMEAWLSGIPLVATDCRALHATETCKFAEVPHLINSGVNGFLVRTPEEAQKTFRSLASDRALAREIGAAGAEKARSLFSYTVIAQQWQMFFESIGLPIVVKVQAIPLSDDLDQNQRNGSPSRINEAMPSIAAPVRRKGLISRLFSR